MRTLLNNQKRGNQRAPGDCTDRALEERRDSVGTDSRADLWFNSADGTKLCKVMAEVEGEGQEGLKSIYESLSIGFQVNRALRIEHMMKPRLYGGLGLGVEEVRGLG
jgi:hypothetical protein